MRPPRRSTARQPSRQTRRLDGGALPHPEGADGVRDPHPLGGLVRVEERDVVLQPDRAVLLAHLFDLGQIVVGAGDDQRAAVRVVGVDPLFLGDATDVVDGVDHRQRDRARASRPYRFVITAGLRGKSATHQPPLRPDAPKPAISLAPPPAHSARGLAAEAVGRPEPSEPGAEDGNVDLGRAFEWRPWCEIVAPVLEPEAVGAVVFGLQAHDGASSRSQSRFSLPG